MDSPAQSDCASAVSLTHATIQRLARQSAVCKLASAVLGGVALLVAAGRVGGESLILAAAPLAVLAFVDGCYGAKARRLAAAAGQYDGGRAPKWSAFFENEAGPGGLRGAGQALAGVLSLSVWPYYVALGLLVAGVGHLAPATPTRITTSTQPFAGMPGGTPVQGFNPGVATPSRPTYPGPTTPGGQQPGSLQQPQQQPLPNRNARFQGGAPAVPGTGTVTQRPPGVAGPNGSAGPSLPGNPVPRPPTSVTPPSSSQTPARVPPAKVQGGAQPSATSPGTGPAPSAPK